LRRGGSSCFFEFILEGREVRIVIYDCGERDVGRFPSFSCHEQCHLTWWNLGRRRVFIGW
jgi:hypothetical protein